MRTGGRGRRWAAALAAVAVLLSGCTTAIAGTAVRVGTDVGTSGTEPVVEGPNGPKTGVDEPTVEVIGDADDPYDDLAKATIADLYVFYGEVFPRDFGREFSPAKELRSYDSRSSSSDVCGVDLAGLVNASYFGRCDAIAWDRGVLMPMMQDEVGVLSAPTVLAHEMGHLVQARLHAPQDSVLVLEQQADCYTGAYWRWVADGHSSFFDFSQGEGMRQTQTAMMYVGDPVGFAGEEDAHGSSFDRSFAFSVGYAGGPTRCNEMDKEEVDARIQQTGFTVVPKNFGNVDITPEVLATVVATLDEYFAEKVPGYRKPTLKAYPGDTPPDCPGNTAVFPVSYCPADHTVYYNLEELQRLGTPTAGWASTNGDFSAITLLASRYALASQTATDAQLSGNQIGLRALCYAGSWAGWMREPRGPERLTLSPNDLNKAVYEVLRSPLAAGDVNGATGTMVVDQVQALHIGVVYGFGQCTDFYAG